MYKRRSRGMAKLALTYLALTLYIIQLNCESLHNGDGEIRTLDPLLARQVLSQLSYAPI